VHTFVGHIEDLGFENDFFDEIYCFDVLEHVENLDLVMKTIKSLLKNEGLLYVEVPYDASEKMLLRVNPNYHREIGHVRIFEFKTIRKTFENY